MLVQIINQSPYPLPAYQTTGSAGMDIYAHLQSPLVIQSMERQLIPTGIMIAMPNGIEAQIRPRSGMALKKGITCLNTPGTIDSDYRGEIKVMLINLSSEPQTIVPGERIAQIVFASYCQINWQEVQVLPDTERGQGGFGSTGSLT